MKYVLDASVAVAALRRNEPGHASALRHCMPLFTGRDHAVVPAIFDIEVVSALVRRGVAIDRVSLFFEKHFSSRTLVTIGARAVQSVRAVVGLTRLRAADALYVWLAARDRLPLVTTDAEILQRAAQAGVHAMAPGGR
jgi:predicted nucleic acid-binding protein